MDEDDLFAGSMDIDDPAALPANTGAGHATAQGLNADEDMSEVAEIMLGLKVQTLFVFRAPYFFLILQGTANANAL